MDELVPGVCFEPKSAGYIEGSPVSKRSEIFLSFAFVSENVRGEDVGILMTSF